MTLTQTPTNSPQMSSFENDLARRVRAGEVIDYSVTPLYGDGALAPAAVLLTAAGTRSQPTARVIWNPAGAPR